MAEPFAWDVTEEGARKWVDAVHDFNASCPICSREAHQLVRRFLDRIDELSEALRIYGACDCGDCKLCVCGHCVELHGAYCLACWWGDGCAEFKPVKAVLTEAAIYDSGKELK